MKKLIKTLAPLCLLVGAVVANPAESQAASANTIATAAAAAVANYMTPEALAWCTKANAYGVRCDGPTQATETRDPIQTSLGYVGCSNPRSWMRWGDGMLYFCGRPLQSYERDIRAKYGVTGT